MAQKPAATAAAAPPDEPPGVISLFRGFSVLSMQVVPGEPAKRRRKAYLVRPRITPPALRIFEDHGAVIVCDEPLLQPQSVGGCVALLIDVHLDRYRHTAERTRILPPCDCGIDLAGSLQCLLWKLLDHGVDGGVHRWRGGRDEPASPEPPTSVFPGRPPPTVLRSFARFQAWISLSRAQRHVEAGRPPDECRRWGVLGVIFARVGIVNECKPIIEQSSNCCHYYAPNTEKLLP